MISWTMRQMDNPPIHFETVTRVEVIDSCGRAYGAFNLGGIVLSIQDDQRTLKVFLEKGE